MNHRDDAAPKPTPTDERAARAPAAWLVGLALVVLCAIPYGQTAGHDFLDWDDDVYITANPHVAGGLTASGAAWAFTESRAGNWHPVTWISHMLDCSLFGVSPAGHHTMNWLLHALAAFVLFIALRAMTGAGWTSAAVAGMFALHPLRVESVAWAAERKDVLSGLFFFLTLAAHAHYARSPSAARYALVVGSLALGLMSKSMLVTAPFVLLLLDAWPLRRFATMTATSIPQRPAARLILEKVPLLALCLVTAFVATRTQDAGGAVSTLTSIAVVDRVANAIASTGLYVWMTLWPANLAFFYPHPSFADAGLAASLYVPAAITAAILIACTFVAFRLRERVPFVIVGWLWFLGMLVPVSGLVQVGAQRMADRYSYLPSVGLYLAIAWALRAAVRSERLPRRAAIVGVAVVLAAWTGLSTLQTRHWRSSFMLAARALEATGENYMAHNLAGRAFDIRGDVASATTHFERVTELAPDFATGHLNLGACFAKASRFDRAETHLTKALELEPGNRAAIVNLAGVHTARGAFDRAITSLDAVLRVDPGALDARFALACALHRAGRLDRASAEYTHLLRAQPAHVDAAYNLASLALTRGNLDAATSTLTHLLSMRPNHVGAINALATVRERQGRAAEAARLLRRALAIDPNHRGARENLARLGARVN